MPGTTRRALWRRGFRNGLSSRTGQRFGAHARFSAPERALWERTRVLPDVERASGKV